MIEFDVREMGSGNCDSAGIPDANPLFESLPHDMKARSEKLNEQI